MLDHLGLDVSDYDRSKAFYTAALEPLGWEVLMEPVPSACGFGGTQDQKPFFWIYDRENVNEGVHVAFGAPDGGPGVREIYHPNYYGAFVLDPDGNNVEAVCHRPA
jgi:catechol 2,3-dioxygenase-like lactoylglutathione lyase family enzyme